MKLIHQKFSAGLVGLLAVFAMGGTVLAQTGKTGTMASGTVVATGTNKMLIPQQGDLSMGTFTAGPTPQ